MSKLELPVTITPSRSELAARCHRRHFLADILGKARYFSPSLEFGSVIHAGVGAVWLNRKDQTQPTWDAALEAEWAKRKVESDSLTLALAKSMLKDYEQKALIAGPLTSQGNFKLVDIEQRFEIPLRDIKLSFQTDRVAFDKDQNWMVIVDSKTAQRLDARWDKQWETSVQMKLYKTGAKSVFATGGRVDVVVEGILKHAPSDIRYYVCPEWSDSMLAEAAFNAYQQAKMDEDLILKGSDIVALRDSLDHVHPKPVPNQKKIEELAVRYTPFNYADCYAYGVECPFRRICTADPEHRVSILNAEYFDVVEETY